MPSLASASLAVAILVAGYLSAVCVTPPDTGPDTPKRYKLERREIVAGPLSASVKGIQLAIFTYHALVALFYPLEAHHGQYPLTADLCPHPENLSDTLFTWSPLVVRSLAMVFLGAYVRLAAYGGLGRNFTFHLSNPDRLITDGVYRYLQHPSYTGAALVTMGMAGLLTRWDTAAGGCWMQPSTLQALDGYGFIFPLGWAIFLFVVLGTRVQKEEAMLKEQFGKEWEEWHRSTKRFIPGVV